MFALNEHKIVPNLTSARVCSTVSVIFDGEFDVCRGMHLRNHANETRERIADENQEFNGGKKDQERNVSRKKVQRSRAEVDPAQRSPW